MAISSSLYSSISGLSTMGEAMSVLGDNVANVNTAAFKSSRSTFQDVLSQSVSTAAGGAQVGRGVTLSTINSLFAQGSFESSSSPTDMAIGGQGFFMLRASDSAEADMYSRAGEFGFDQKGNLVNPMGHFVQGWEIDSASGQAMGTIGDINIGKNTPPVATTNVEVIANLNSNLDAGEEKEITEDRLFANWNGTNANAVTPTDPIESAKYNYTTAVKIYDSKGASHDLRVYFDRTTTQGQWEYLITCDPTEDLRVLTAAEQAIYNPDTKYNYENHKGAGALLYGTIQFDTSGNISEIDAFKVPPDGQVDPSKSENRIKLDTGSSYFTFPSNFNGADTNQEISINFGARYEGKTSTQRQVLVSDAGATENGSKPITSATTWADVSDENGKSIVQGDTFIFEGFDNGSRAVTQLVYTVSPANNIQDLLNQIESTFGCTASIDGSGRLKMSDDIAGESGMFVTHFETISQNGSTPFGGAYGTVNNAFSVTSEGITLDGTTAITDDSKLLVPLQGSNTIPLAVGDTFVFSGTDVDNAAVAATTFTVGAADTISDLLAFIDTAFGGANSGVKSVLDQDGNIRVMDTTHSTVLSVSAAYASGAASGANPFGLVDGGAAVALTPSASVTGNINITTAKRMVMSTGRAFNSSTGDVTPILAATQWSSVYDDNSNPLINGGFPRGVSDGDTIRFVGKKGDGSSVDFTFQVEYTKAVDGKPGTVQDLLNELETEFECQASIDTAGRLVLTDRVADTVNSTSQLAVSSVTYPINTNGHDIFGVANTPFDFVPSDLTAEDGSVQGDVVTTTFAPEALSTTQYAATSTTVFQDQDGFASGFLQSVSTDVNGVITGHYSNGQVLKKAMVSLANFSNLAGLSKHGGNIFTETTESGAPVTGAPGTNGLGSIAPNALEQSNVDLGVEFVKLITVQRGFQANSKIITTTDDMLNELINIKR